MEKKILIAFLKLFLEKKFNEWGREIGPSLTSIDTKEAKHLLLDCVEVAFKEIVKERREKLVS